MIVQTVGLSDFRDAFRACDRNENFSHEGKKVLFEYLEQYSDDTGEPIELDVIALCCDYEESTVQELIDNYNIDTLDYDGEEASAEDKADLVREYLSDNTALCGETSSGTFIYACF